MKSVLKINFDYFWKDFDPNDNYFTRVLNKFAQIELSDQPDLFFFTHAYPGSKRDYLKHRCHRVFLGWENERANWNITDYVLDSDFYENNPRHKRWPIWAAWNLEPLIQSKNPDLYRNKKKFACMVVSNAHAKERIDFFHRLSKYKKIDSGGRYLNNIGGPVTDKMEFIKDYKFVLSFENSSYPGYTTEKLIEPMLVNSIPVYWGNEKIGMDFNTNSFIHVNGYSSFDEAIEHLIELDQDEEKYMEMALQPWFNENRIPEEMLGDRLEDFIRFILEDMKNKRPIGSFFFKRQLHLLQLFIENIRDRAFARLKIKKGFR